MIIDIHNHIVAGEELSRYQASLINSRGFHGKRKPPVTEESIKSATWQGHKHTEVLDQVGTDMAFISPRPYTMMHSEKPEKIVHWYCEAVNDAIALQVKVEPTRFRGIAGLPQNAGVGPENTFDEIDRCINELGMVGIMINPDPGEGDGLTPGMGDEYWYPLYEKMVSMDIPALVHSASCRNQRESFHGHFITEESIAILSLLNSNVFSDFPGLKLIISHGGGSVPYQVGRWRSQLRGPGNTENFDERLQQLYFDSALYNTESLELLFKVVTPDRCLFGTERPGAGSKPNPRTGRWYDDVKPLIDEMDWLSEEEKAGILGGNAEKVFTRFKANGKPAKAPPPRAKGRHVDVPVNWRPTGGYGPNPDMATIVAILRAADGAPVPIRDILPHMVTGTRDTVHVRWAVRTRLAKRGYGIVVQGRGQDATLQLVTDPGGDA